MGWWPRTGKRRVPAAAMLAALFCCAQVLGVTQWQGRPYSVMLTGGIQAVGQSCTGSSVLTLSHDGPCTINVSVPQGGAELLTLGGAGSGGGTLVTSYKITGIADQDADWLSSDAFLLRSYSVPGGAGTEHLTLSVRGTAPTDRAPEPGNYTAAIILTVTF
jgi:hypothetical protein